VIDFINNLDALQSLHRELSEFGQVSATSVLEVNVDVSVSYGRDPDNIAIHVGTAVIIGASETPTDQNLRSELVSWHHVVLKRVAESR
jgi:hypothetical protein